MKILSENRRDNVITAVVTVMALTGVVIGGSVIYRAADDSDKSKEPEKTEKEVTPTTFPLAEQRAGESSRVSQLPNQNLGLAKAGLSRIPQYDSVTNAVRFCGELGTRVTGVDEKSALCVTPDGRSARVTPENDGPSRVLCGFVGGKLITVALGEDYREFGVPACKIPR